MTQTPSLGLCMIVKNEEKMLPGCLDSVKGIVQEIVIVDTGSSDSTVDIAHRYGANVVCINWEQSFSHARNVALKNAKSDWLLLLDADERLDQQGIPAILNFIVTTDLDGAHLVMHNRIGKDGSGVSVHQALRLLRNNGQYQYVGAIHEQIRRFDGQPCTDRFALLQASVQHWGYMEDVVVEKGKRSRNLPILEKELQENPQNGFMLFNLGNEYLAIHDYTSAWETFSQGLQHINIHDAYAPHLYYRAAMCLNIINQPQQAIELLTKGLGLYPACTDMQLLMAHVYFGWERYTLAIASYEKALSLGEPPPSLRFTLQCESLSPLLGLARLHKRLHDPVKAMEYYTRALSIDGKQISILYEIGELLGMIYTDPAKAAQQLSLYFGSLDHLPNRIVYIDILTRHRFYAQAETALDMLASPNEYPADIALLRAKLCLLHHHDKKAALSHLATALKNLDSPTLIADTPKMIGRYYFVATLLEDVQAANQPLVHIQKYCSADEYTIYMLAYNTYTQSAAQVTAEIEDTASALSIIEELLGILLAMHAFDEFEKLLYMYNHIDSDQVLVSLARVYHKHKLDTLAKQTLLRSFVEFGTLNREAIRLLSQLSA